jgi:hypothetical protein
MISAGIRQMADVNIRAFLAFLQDGSDVWPATGPWGSTNGTVALANSEQKFAKWQIDFIDIFCPRFGRFFANATVPKRVG